MSESTSTDEKKPEEKAASSGGGMIPMIISSAVVALVLGGVGFALAFYVLPSRVAGQIQAQQAATSPDPTVDPKSTNTTPAVVSAAATPTVKEHSQRSAEELASQGGKAVTKFSIEEVTVNIAETRGSRFLRAGVYFEASPAVLEELEANRARIVDTLAAILSSKTLDQLTAPTIRGLLRQELLGTINPTLKEGRIDNVYFTDLLIQ